MILQPRKENSNAIQASDRFHLLKNLSSYCSDYLSALQYSLKNVC